MRTWTYTWTVSAVLHGLVAVALAATHRSAPASQPVRLRIITSGQASGGVHGSEARSGTTLPAPARTVAAAAAPKAKKTHASHKAVAPAQAVATAQPAARAAPAAGSAGVPTAEPLRGAGGQGSGLSGEGPGLGHGPQLVRTSVIIPDYTDDALEAAFEGLLEVEVMVDEQGHVVKAKLRNPSGYRIDAGVLAAAKAAHYAPAVTMDGRPTLALAQLKFNFRIP